MLEQMEEEIHQSGGQLPANIYKYV
jgi:hypothetical protein